MAASWLEIGVAIVTGGAAGKLIDLFIQRGRHAFDREALLWKEVGELRGEIKSLNQRLDLVQSENVTLRLENAALKVEVNEEREAQGKPAKYPAPVSTTTTTTITVAPA